jgi:alpha/beta superfamily hydrolase
LCEETGLLLFGVRVNLHLVGATSGRWGNAGIGAESLALERIAFVRATRPQ